jgi:rod shape-determining protein MreD
VKRYLLLLILVYMALILDAASSAWALPAGTAPQFLLMTSAIALLLCAGAGAIVWAAAIGLLCDALSSGPPGLNVVLLANLAFFAQVFGIRSLRDSAFAGGAFVWVYVTLAALGSLLLQHTLQGTDVDLRYLAQYAAGRAGASTALFLAVVLTGRGLRRTLHLALPSARVGDGRRTWAPS